MVRAQMIENVKKEMSPQQFVAYVNTTFPNGDPSRIIYDYAIELHKNNKLEDAFYLYNEAIKSSNGQNYEMYVNLALAQAQNKDYDGAILTLQKAKSNFPTNETIDSTIKDISDMKFDTQMAKASEFYKSQNYKEAITTYLSINPPTADTMLGVATSYQELGDTNSAIGYYKKALDLKPLDSDIAYYIAVLYGENEDYENAKIYLGKSIAFNKNNKNASDYLAQIEEADRANLLNNAIAKYEENKLEDSLTDFNKLLTKEPKNAYALYYRGMIYDTTGKRYEAIKDLKQAYELNKDFSICNYLIASNYDSLEKYKDAYTYYTSYANSDVPDDEYKQYAKARAEELKEYAKK